MPQSVAIIIPCHNESENVPLIYQELVKTFRDNLTALQAQIWFVNDGSSDDTLQQIKQLQAKDDQVHFIDLSRSFGKEAAMYAGLSTAKADYYAVMDADLQDPPAMLPDMYAALQDGYDMAVLNALTAQAKLGCVHFSRIYSINSLIKSRKLKLYQGHGISA